MLLDDFHRADQHAGVPDVAGEGLRQSLDSCFSDGADDSDNAVTLLLTGDQESNGGGGKGADWKRQRASLIRYLLLVGALLTFALIALVVKVLAKGKTVNRYPVVSNGTHSFGPTTIVVSVDGLRADYLDRGISPAINGLASEGIRATYMTPAFPSTTFPNHYSIVTGLHPESHGIVGNVFWDPVLNDSFYYTDPNRSWDSKWWGGEPIWVTAVLQGLRSAVCMWPGSSAVIRGTRPTFEIPYNPSVTSNEKVAQALRWIDEPDISKRANLIAVYIPNVDHAGHTYGPNSTEIDEALREVDAAMGRLVQALDRRNLRHIVNLIILSDHGMTTSSADDLIYLEDWMDVRLVREVDGFPLGGLWLTDDSAIADVYRNLSRTDGNKTKHFEVYYREDVPERFHYSKNRRIAPIVVMPDVGHVVVVDRKAFPADQPYPLRGLHGWDNRDPKMRASFVARGPAFKPVRRRPAGDVNFVAPFANTEVYGLLCRLLHLDAAPNNGTISGARSIEKLMK